MTQEYEFNDDDKAADNEAYQQAVDDLCEIVMNMADTLRSTSHLDARYFANSAITLVDEAGRVLRVIRDGLGEFEPRDNAEAIHVLDPRRAPVTTG